MDWGWPCACQEPVRHQRLRDYGLRQGNFQLRTLRKRAARNGAGYASVGAVIEERRASRRGLDRFDSRRLTMFIQTTASITYSRRVHGGSCHMPDHDDRDRHGDGGHTGYRSGQLRDGADQRGEYRVGVSQRYSSLVHGDDFVPERKRYSDGTATSFTVASGVISSVSLHSRRYG